MSDNIGNLLNRFKKQLIQLGITSTDKLLVAVSGGVDSMVLSHLLLKADLPHSIAHVDHNTRNGQSKHDKNFVQKYAQDNQLNCYVHSLIINSSTGNFHDLAHKARYRFFNSLGYDKVLTAHHYDDEVETILINFLNGRSIASIPEAHGAVLRPLLSFKKAEILSYAEENKVVYREDQSNSENKYLRNFIRNTTLPQLSKKLEGNLGNRLVSLAKRSREDKLLLESLITQMALPLYNGDQMIIPIDHIKKPSSTLLYHLIKQYGFSREISLQIHTALDKKGASFYSGEKVCVVGKSELVIANKPNLWKPLSIHLDSLPLSLFVEDYRYTLTIVESYTCLKDKHNCFIPLGLLTSTIEIRRWKEGDRIEPYGMSGKSKKLKKVFADKQIDVHNKKLLPLFVHKNDIIWISSLMSSERYKVKAQGPYLKIERLTYS